ncbi:hypothetical protein ABEB36_007503 [Hypothenemus hampei]
MAGTASQENPIPFSLQNMPNSANIKIQKSSNIFSLLVRKARRKKINKIDGIKNLHVSSQNLSASSMMSLTTHIEKDVDIYSQNCDKKVAQNQEMLWENHEIRNETDMSNHLDVSSNKTNKDLLGLKNSQSGNTFEDNMAHTNFKNIEEVDFTNIQDETVLTSFMSFTKPTINVTQVDALEYLQELTKRFQESEKHITDLLIKYITDPNVQEDLKNTVSNYAKLQWEAERRSCTMANNIWMQQLEVSKTQEKILHNTLQTLMKQNRQLQIEKESLYRKYEKANKYLKGFSDYKGKYQESNSQFDSILRHNEKLQTKLETIFKKIESLEGELDIFQKQNDYMEEQVKHSTIKMQNMTAIFHKMKTDYEIEQISLNIRLETQEQVLKEAFDIGNSLLEDVNNLRKEPKDVILGISESTFKIRSNSLNNLLQLCRTCLNELSTEILNLYSENSLKDKDLINLKDANNNLQENLKTKNAEIEKISENLEQHSMVLNEKFLLEQRCKKLESEVEAVEGKMEKLKAEYEVERNNLWQGFMENNKFLKDLEEKDNMIEQTKLFMANVASENYSLRNEIIALNNLIKETGAGDMISEIKKKHQELELIKTDLDKLKSENTQLRIQIENARNEHIAINTSQEMTYKTLQRQMKELERLNEDNQNLRQKAEIEHQTVLSLQNERMKYLQEKSILKSIIQHLRGELIKVRQLEDNLANATKEASKLNLVTEYNKHEAVKLKQALVNKDSIIEELRQSLHKLNELQIKNSQEKLILCQELNEVCQLKEKLSDVLNTEVKKNAELGQSKEAIVKSVNSQMQRIEEQHRNERVAMRSLLNDMKNVTDEKDNALKEKYKLELDTKQLKANIKEYDEKYNIAIKEIAMNSDEVKELRKELERYEKRHKESKEHLENESMKYDSNIKQLKKLIDQLRNDKKELEKSNEYLKNVSDKLRKELDEMRQVEKLTSDNMKSLRKDQDEMKQLLTDQTQMTRDLLKEKEKYSDEKYELINEKNILIKETKYLNALIDKVTTDLEKSIQTAEDKESMYKEELQEAKKIILSYGKDIQDLKQLIELKEKQIEELKDIGKIEEIYEKRMNRLKEEMQQVEKECIHLRQTNEDLDKQLSDLREEYSKVQNQLVHFQKETEILESQLKFVLDQKDEDYIFFKKRIEKISKTRDELEEQSEKEVTKLKDQLQEANNKLANEKIAYDTLAEIQKDVSGKFMKSIKDLVDEKNAKQEMMDKVIKMRVDLENVERENKELQEQKNSLTNKLKDSDNQKLMHAEENLRLQEKCVKLENEIKKIQTDCGPCSEPINNKCDENLQVVNDKLQNDLDTHLCTIHKLRMEIAEFKKQLTLFEIERSEIALRLHETEKKLETEKILAEQLKNTQKLLLAAVIQLRDDGKVAPVDCIHLLHMARSSDHLSPEATNTDN